MLVLQKEGKWYRSEHKERKNIRKGINEGKIKSFFLILTDLTEKFVQKNKNNSVSVIVAYRYVKWMTAML